MTDPTRELLERALLLSADERSLLITELLASLESGQEPQHQVDSAWAAEVERRIRTMPASGARLREASEVRAQLRTDLREQRRTR